jgi:hypothetical protein
MLVPPLFRFFSFISHPVSRPRISASVLLVHRFSLRYMLTLAQLHIASRPSTCIFYLSTVDFTIKMRSTIALALAGSLATVHAGSSRARPFEHRQTLLTCSSRPRRLHFATVLGSKGHGLEGYQYPRKCLGPCCVHVQSPRRYVSRMSLESRQRLLICFLRPRRHRFSSVPGSTEGRRHRFSSVPGSNEGCRSLRRYVLRPRQLGHAHEGSCAGREALVLRPRYLPRSVHHPLMLLISS